MKSEKAGNKMGAVLFGGWFEVNIEVGIVILLVYLFAGYFRKFYGAKWLKIMWLLLAARLLIPVYLTTYSGYVARWESREALEDFFSYIWVGGMVLVSLFYIIAYVIFCLNLQQSLYPIEDDELHVQIRYLQIKYLGKVKLSVYGSRNVSSPMLTGFLSPKLIIPPRRKKWTEEELELIIGHELCHYAQAVKGQDRLFLRSK